MRIELTVDPHNQWFATVWVIANGQKAKIEFKVDSGCNALVLSHETLKKLAISTKPLDLEKLPDMTGKLATGVKSRFKQLGVVSLYSINKPPVHICNAKAICHARRETNDLIGTEVLQQFTDVNFHLSGHKYMELLKS